MILRILRILNSKKIIYYSKIEKILGKNGIDVVYDGVGIKTFDGSIETL